MYRFLGRWMLFEADKGTGTGDASGNNNGGNEGANNEAKFTQADVDRLIGERLKRAEESAAQKSRKAAEDAEAKALADSQKFKELSEKQAARLLELETASGETGKAIEQLNADRDRYRKALEENVKERRKGLGEHIVALLDNLDPIAQLDWLTKNAAKLGGAAGGPPPTPNAQNGDVAQKEEARKKFQAGYGEL